MATAATNDVLRFDDVTVCYGPTPAVHHLSAELPCVRWSR